MSYSKEKENRLKELLEEIEARKDPDCVAATYKDSPALKEITEIVEEQLAKDDDKETIVDSIAILRYVIYEYETYGRFALSARLYNLVLSLAVKLKQQYGDEIKDIKDVFYGALQTRNYYVDDDCEDIVAIAKEIIDENEVEIVLNQRKKNRRALKHDPVELTEKYLAVIDEVDEKIEKNRVTYGRGSCHEVWALKSEYLLEHNIKWRSLHSLNPRGHFD